MHYTILSEFFSVFVLTVCIVYIVTFPDGFIIFDINVYDVYDKRIITRIIWSIRTCKLLDQ